METNPASDKQRAFATRLVRERLVPVSGTSSEARLIARAEDLMETPQTRFLGKREASALIDWLLTLPRRPAEDQPEQPEIGIYVLPDGTIVQAKQNKAKTNVYTKRWVVIGGERLVDATEEHVHGEWEYEPSLKRQLSTARVMTLDEAKDFILRYGQCVRCGRRLKAAQSVERGIGPVCIQYFQQFAA
jgi:hypothetical protein